MKKVLLGIGIAMFALSSVNAQTFTTEVTADTAYVAINKAFFDYYNKIKNISANNIKIDWKVTASDFPSDWASDTRLGICDNQTCITNSNNQLLNGTVYTSLDYVPNVDGDWHFQLADFAAVTPGTHYVTVNYKENGGTYDVTKTFIFTVWATGLSTVKVETDNIVLYPNPATDKINIAFTSNSNVEVLSIHNYVGKEVAKYKVTGDQMSINIKSIPTGMYYVRFIDENGSVTATKRFTHR